VRYLEIRPSPDLAQDIQCYWELEGDDVLGEPIFPDGRVEIVIHLGARPRIVGETSRQPEVMVVGQMTRALRVHETTGLHAVGVRFTPTGARHWLAAPLDECTDRIYDFGGMASRTAAGLRAAVHRGGSLHPSVAALESALRDSRTTRWTSPRAVHQAVRQAVASHGHLRVDALADSVGLGVRQLERQFLESVGLSPKAFLKTARLQQALRGLRAGHAPADVAEDCGFADQAHLAREFRHVAGAPAREIALDRIAFL
jgi:AraC-like DNA-binding protein